MSHRKDGLPRAQRPRQPQTSAASLSSSAARKTTNMVTDELSPGFRNQADFWFDFARTGGYLRHCQAQVGLAVQEFRELIDGTKGLPSQRTHEYGSYVLEAMETNRPARINSNVPNDDLITNLPGGVASRCLVDANGCKAWSSAVCTLPQIHAMVDELLEAQARWLPQFQA